MMKSRREGASADRRSDFPTARLTGLTRGQVIYMALRESHIAGVVLGLVDVAGARE
jgi:hypothetical protein